MCCECAVSAMQQDTRDTHQLQVGSKYHQMVPWHSVRSVAHPPNITKALSLGHLAFAGNVYVAIAKAGYQHGMNLTCLGGVWPQVGFGGLMAAGGYSSMSRKYGVLADHILAAKVVDARGRLLQADEHNNPDLFFAVR
eukprot:GHUV01029389.1.p2 GENE.GHUV01029389.1~~GHUV01029389.1.p2  ORF type:complete len:138 (+),score=38.13 GHUV01029389.1:1119-1532(+)